MRATSEGFDADSLMWIAGFNCDTDGFRQPAAAALTSCL